MFRLEHVVVWERDLKADSVRFRLIDNGSVAVSGQVGDLEARIVQDSASVREDGLYLTRHDDTFRIWLQDSGVRRDLAFSYVPVGNDLFARNYGVFESDALRRAHVAIIGVGSGGSAVLRELVRAGVGRFTIVDSDRLSAGNVCRHELGLRDVGRLKVDALRDYVLDRNPEAQVVTRAWHVDGGSAAELMDLISADRPQVLVCGTDNRESRLLVNRIGVLLGVYTLFGAVRHRAFAGDVLQIVPGITPCYQCFVTSLPVEAQVRSVERGLDGPLPSYSDRPATPEPGLSIDIGAVALMMAKLAVTELLQGSGSERFGLLAEDLVAPAFFWLARREPGTSYENWPTLADSVGDGPRILQWIGRWLERDESCPVCAQPATTVTEEEQDLFRPAPS